MFISFHQVLFSTHTLYSSHFTLDHEFSGTSLFTDPLDDPRRKKKAQLASHYAQRSEIPGDKETREWDEFCSRTTRTMSLGLRLEFVATRHRKAPSQPTFGTRHLSSPLNAPGPGCQYMQRPYPIKTIAENGRHPRCNVTPTTTTAHAPDRIPRQNATLQGCNPPRPLAENSVY